MLKIQRLNHLSDRLEASISDLHSILQRRAEYCERYLLVDPERPEKHREVLRVRGDFRTIQERIYRRILLPTLRPSPYSHGGVKGRHILTHADPHKESAFCFTTDVADFYPSISHQRIYRLFTVELLCSPDVARLLTQFCTHRYHLALGLVTSPILANQVMLRLDGRLGNLCEKLDLRYSRFVDDIAISGSFDLGEKISGIAGTVTQMFREQGLNIHKHQFGRLSNGKSKDRVMITKVRIKHGNFDVSKVFLDKLMGQLEDARQIAKGQRPSGHYYSKGQIRGRVEFVGWVNRSRREELRKAFLTIPWNLVSKNAASLGLVIAKKRLEKIEECTAENACVE